MLYTGQDGNQVANANPNVGGNTPFSGDKGYVNSSGTYVNSSPSAQPISVDGLGTPSSPLSVPQSSPTTYPAVSVQPPSGTTVSDNGTASVPPPTGNTSDTRDWIKTKLADLGSTLGTKSAVEGQLQTQNGVSQKTLDATASYNAYNQAKLDLAQKLEKMQETNPTGATALGKSQEYAITEREGNANLANLAVIAQSAQGNLTAAQAIVDAKIKAQFQPVQDQIDFLTKFSSVNNNDLSDSEKQQLTVKADKMKIDNASVQTAASDIHQALLKNGAPANAYSAVDAITTRYTNGDINAAEAQSQMYAAAAKYGGNENASSLTPTQINNGATNAGLDVSTFKSLSFDVQNFFSNSPAANVFSVTKDLKSIGTGDLSIDDFTKNVNNGTYGNISPSVKSWMLDQAKLGSEHAPPKYFTWYNPSTWGLPNAPAAK